MQTFPTLAFQGDIRVAEDTVNKVVHSGFFKATALAGFTAERSRPFDLLSEEFADIWERGLRWDLIDLARSLTYAAVFPADKPSWDAATFDFLT